jgi:hypothetical protein
MYGCDLMYLLAAHIEPFAVISTSNGYGRIVEKHAPEAVVDYGGCQ